MKQAAYRDLEKGQTNVVLEDRENVVVLSWRRKKRIINEVVVGIQFRRIRINDIIFQCNKKDSCFKTYDNIVAIFKNIVEVQNEVYFVGFYFSIAVDAYEYPLPSSHLGIMKVSNQNKQKQIFRLTQIACKCWLMPDGDAHVCVPLLHSMPLFK